MKIKFQRDDDFSFFKKELKEILSSREFRKLKNPDYKKAAVKIILMNKNQQPHVLVTKRSDKVKTHKGQMSLPGGTFDSTDQNILATVYRETYEEVGVSSEKIDFLGRFDDYISIFGFHVSCFVGAIDYPFPYKFNQDEIVDYVEVPLEIFINRQYDKVDFYYHEGKQIKMFTYFYKGFEIWGLTARFLTDFGKIFK